MSKIFGIGLPKTGTSSLCQAMTELGYSSIHYSDSPDYDVHYNDFICDMPMQTRFDFYDKRYPNSKFVLTTRNIDSWLDSCDRWINDRPVLKQSIAGRYRLELYGIITYDKQIFTDTYNKFHNNILNYFSNRIKDLLIIDICSNPSWIELCNFTGKPIPEIPFPHLNKNEKRLCDDGK